MRQPYKKFFKESARSPEEQADDVWSEFTDSDLYNEVRAWQIEDIHPEVIRFLEDTMDGMHITGHTRQAVEQILETKLDRFVNGLIEEREHPEPYGGY